MLHAVQRILLINWFKLTWIQEFWTDRHAMPAANSVYRWLSDSENSSGEFAIFSRNPDFVARLGCFLRLPPPTLPLHQSPRLDLGRSRQRHGYARVAVVFVEFYLSTHWKYNHRLWTGSPWPKLVEETFKAQNDWRATRDRGQIPPNLEKGGR